MEEEIRRIAQENISNRNKGGIGLILSIIFFILFFAYSVESNFEYVPSIVGSIIVPLIGFYISNRFYNRVIGKKTELDYEIERLKALYPEEKLALPRIDNDELKLKEMIQNSNQNGLV